jgi:folate-binding protein YgfZ
MPKPQSCVSFLTGEHASLREDTDVLIAIPETIDRLGVKGIDTFRFLQGQVTCDMTEVEQGAIRLGTHCTPKGRAQASFIAAREPDGVCLFLPAGMSGPTFTQLKKYAAFSKVSLEEAAGMSLALIAGKGAEDWLASVCSPSSGEKTPVLSERLPGDTPAWLMCFPGMMRDDLLAGAPEGSLLGHDQAFWQILTLAGQTHVFPETQEHFIPQELNHDLSGGISFRKGCYKGQEIIARLHFRGTPKYRTRLYRGLGPTPLPGTACVDSEGHKVGEVAQVAAIDSQGSLVLAVVRQDVDTRQRLDAKGIAGNADGESTTRCELTPLVGGCAIPPESA